MRPNKTLYLLSIILAFSLAGLSGVYAQNKGKTAIKAVPRVDLNRYAGKWYEIAKYPNKFQKQCVGNTTAEYSIKSNGRIEIVNECVRKNGTKDRAVGEAKIADKRSNAKLKVRFAPGLFSILPFVWGDYWVIELDDQYQYAVIGEPRRDYFWILSRQAEIDDATLQAILRRAEAVGYNPGKVERTRQNLTILRGTVIPGT